MKYPKKYIKYWLIGTAISLLGVILARKMTQGSIESLIGYAIAIIGLTVIAFGVSKKAHDPNI